MLCLGSGMGLGVSWDWDCWGWGMYYAMEVLRKDRSTRICVCVCPSAHISCDSIQKQSGDLYSVCTVVVLIVLSSLSLYTDPIACVREATNS